MNATPDHGEHADEARWRAARRYRLLVVAGIAGTMLLPPLLVWRVSEHPAALRWAVVAGVLLGAGHALGHRSEPSSSIEWLEGLVAGDVRISRWVGVSLLAAGVALAALWAL